MGTLSEHTSAFACCHCQTTPNSTPLHSCAVLLSHCCCCWQKIVHLLLQHHFYSVFSVVFALSFKYCIFSLDFFYRSEYESWLKYLKHCRYDINLCEIKEAYATRNRVLFSRWIRPYISASVYILGVLFLCSRLQLAFFETINYQNNTGYKKCTPLWSILTS